MKKRLVANVTLAERFFPEGFSAPFFQVGSLAPEVGRSAVDDRIDSLDDVNRTVHLTLLAIAESLHRAGLTLFELQNKRVGIILGTTVGCTFHNEEYYVQWRDGQNPPSDALLRYLHSHLSSVVRDMLGLNGPTLVITNACASGTDAIGIAKSWLEYDKCDIVIAGGADELSRVACHGFKSLMLYSDQDCSPFDTGRKGLNLGEGAGVLVMQRQSDALQNRGKIYGRVLGYGTSGDAHHPTAPHPEGLGLQRAVASALQESGLTVSDISFINAHGTGTPTNDLAETHAIAALGFKPDITPVVSTKGFTGHTLGAAGGVEAVYTLMALNDGKVQGTGGCKNLDHALSFPALTESEECVLKGSVGISQSLAFGGSNSALVIEGADA